MSGPSIILTGATGMIGGLALRYALADPEVGSVTALGRRPTGVQHSKLEEVQHTDFTNFDTAADAMVGHDVALFCLGAYTGAVPDQEFRRITVDYTLAFAHALYAGSPKAAFCLLSGQGADQTEKSRISFARYKGAAEKGLLEVGFPRVHIFRPGYIYPVTPRGEPNVSYRIMRTLYPAVRRIYPNIGILSEELARAMVTAGLKGTPGHDSPILENRDLRRLVREAP